MLTKNKSSLPTARPPSGQTLSGLGRRALLVLPAAFPALGLAAPRSHLAAPAVHRGAKPPPPLVMLDPGHGGKDPGAIGVSGTYEKHIAEAASAELERRLLAGGRYRVARTRDRDIFIPLEDRVAIAQGRRAALFISMHADALHDPSVRGASVYTLSDHASDGQTAALAARENSADRFAGPRFAGTSPQVQAILASLVRQETLVGSTHLAHAVVTSFRGQIGLLDNPDRHAGFLVLKSAVIPSVLVEMGFMSNRLDEAALRQSSHRTVIAVQMQRAIERYFASAGSYAQMTG